MKVKFFSLFLIFLLLFSVTCFAASAKEVNMELNFSEDYIVITQGNASDYSEILEKMGYTTKSFKALFTEGSLVAFALHSDSKTQIQIRAVSTDFSSQISDFGLLSSQNKAIVAKQLVPEYSSITVSNDTHYIYSRADIDDESGKYASQQYSTIKNGVLYTVGIYSNNASASVAQDIIDSIIIKYERQKSGFTFVLSIILVLIFILAFVALSIYIIVSIIIQARNREDNDVREFVRIKRRKF